MTAVTRALSNPLNPLAAALRLMACKHRLMDLIQADADSSLQQSAAKDYLTACSDLGIAEAASQPMEAR